MFELIFNEKKVGIFAHLPGDILLTSTQGLIIKSLSPRPPQEGGSRGMELLGCLLFLPPFPLGNRGIAAIGELATVGKGWG